MRIARHFTAPEWLALAAVALTPVALALDYRVGVLLVDDLVHYRPIGESAGRLLEYRQILGTSQVLWLVAGALALAVPRLRAGFATVPALGLTVVLALVLVATALRDGFDRTTLVLVCSTILPLVAIAAVLSHPSLRPATRRLLVTVTAGTAALAVGATLAKAFVSGTLDERFAVFLYGSAPDAGVVLAVLVLLVPAARAPIWARAAAGAVLVAALVLTQTRGGLLAAAGGTVVLAAFVPRLRIPLLATLAVGIGAFLLVSDRSLTFQDTASDFRLQNLEYHWDLFLQRPLLGHGLSEASLDGVRAAHNTLLHIADAAGLFAVVAWLVAWLGPPVRRVFAGDRSLPTAVACGCGTSALLGWMITGPDVLDYSPPTNLLPLALATSLAMPVAVGFGPAFSVLRRPRLVLPVMAVAAVTIAAVYVLRPSDQTFGEERALARMDVNRYARLCSPDCVVLEERRIRDDLWRFTLRNVHQDPFCVDVVVVPGRRQDGRFDGVDRVPCA